jgi:transcriptional regulator with XRE-family HTH domain
MAKGGISKRFGLVVRAKRTALGLTQETLAEKAKLHPTYISMVERGVRNPTLDAAAQIADALKIGLPELIAEAIGNPSRKESRHE